MPSTEMELRAKRAIEGWQVPPAFAEIIDPAGWVNAILLKRKYVEPNPEFISTMLALSAISAESVEEAFAQSGIIGVQELVRDQPGAATEPFEITDLYVAATDFETGNPCYVIISARYLGTGDEFRCTTGATNIQATLIGLLRNGAWPIRAKFKRGESKDKGGRYLLFLMPPD